MSDARDELMDIIHANMHQIDGFGRCNLQAISDLADALLAAGYSRNAPRSQA